MTSLYRIREKVESLPVLPVLLPWLLYTYESPGVCIETLLHSADLATTVYNPLVSQDSFLVSFQQFVPLLGVIYSQNAKTMRLWKYCLLVNRFELWYPARHMG